MKTFAVITWFTSLALSFWTDWRLGVALFVFNCNLSVALSMLTMQLREQKRMITATNHRVDQLELREPIDDLQQDVEMMKPAPGWEHFYKAALAKIRELRTYLDRCN